MLAAAFILRLLLIFRGGQEFWNDENRYKRAFNFFQASMHGEFRSAAYLLSRPPHSGFVLAALPAAAAHATAVRLTGQPPDALLKIPATVLSLYSLAVLLLIYMLARQRGATQNEATLALFLGVLSTSLLIYSRHLLPYDASLAMALGGIHLSAHRKWKAGFAGVLITLAFFTYHGTWPLCSVAAALAIWSNRHRLHLILGMGLPAIFFTTARFLGHGDMLWQALSHFAGTITQGDPGQNWRMTWAYFVKTDPVLLGLTFVTAWRAAPRPRYWLVISAMVYLLICLSDFGGMVAYGRMFRQLTPFFCLAAAAGIFTQRKWKHRLFIGVGLGLAFTQLTVHFAQLISMQFPRDVEAKILRTFSDVQRDVTVTGTFARPDARLPSTRYVLLNTLTLFPADAPKPPPQGRVLFQTSHPLEFAPYQFEGYSTVQRRVLRESDISIRLIQLPISFDSRRQDH